MMTERSLCQEDGPPLTDRAGNAIPNFIRNSPYFTQFGFRKFRNGGPYAFLNQTATDTNGYGVQAQVEHTFHDARDDQPSDCRRQL